MLTVPFLTDLDPQLAVKGSRDPLGVQTVWARLGRHRKGRRAFCVARFNGRCRQHAPTGWSQLVLQARIDGSSLVCAQGEFNEPRPALPFIADHNFRP